MISSWNHLCLIDTEYDVFIGKFDKLLILKLREKTLFKLKSGNRVKY